MEKGWGFFCLMPVSINKQRRTVDIIGKKCLLLTSGKGDFCNMFDS